MIVLILVILIFFKIYIKNVNHFFIAAVLLSTMIINELYFNVNEHFTFNHSDSFIKHKNKQKCIFDNQKKIITDYNYSLTDEAITNCHKIKDISHCTLNSKCKYSHEFNKCLDKTLDCEKNYCEDGSNCEYNYEDMEKTSCHYIDSKDKCNNLTKKLSSCENKKMIDCNDEQCLWNYNKNVCELKKDTCIGEEETKCKDNKKCKWNFYSDIYNINEDSNLKECHDFNKFVKNNRMFIKGIVNNTTLSDLEKLLEEDVYKDVRYYGFRYDEKNNGHGYLLQLSNLNSINGTRTSILNCMNNDKYTGDESHIVIFEKKGQCSNNEKSCNWKNNSMKNCNLINLKEDCLDDKDCYFDDTNNKCINKGFCYDNCNMKKDKDSCETHIDLMDNKMCFWDNINNKCLNKDCFWNNEKC